jgi:hypothetical protein
MSNNQCAECGNTFRSSVSWKSELTTEMVQDLTAEQLAMLIACLDEAVEIVASDFGIGQ